MKITRRQLRSLIREMYSPNFELMGTMSDIGSPMVKQLATYIIPYQGRVSFEIKERGDSISVDMYLNDVLVGFVAADFVGDMCADCYIIGLSSTAGGENTKPGDIAQFRNDLINDDRIEYGSYGPILYELCLELASKKGPEVYLTCDKNSLEPAAYNVWAYYLDNRPDVIKKQLDPERVPAEFRITPEDPTDDCESLTSEEFYQFYTQKLVHPQGPSDDPKGMYDEYIDYVKTKDPIMKGYRKNSTPFLNIIKELGMIK